MGDTIEELHRRHVQERLDEILQAVRETNGRLRLAENKITALQVGYAVGAVAFSGLYLWLLSVLAPGK